MKLEAQIDLLWGYVYDFYEKYDNIEDERFLAYLWVMQNDQPLWYTKMHFILMVNMFRSLLLVDDYIDDVILIMDDQGISNYADLNGGLTYELAVVLEEKLNEQQSPATMVLGRLENMEIGVLEKDFVFGFIMDIRGLFE